MGRLKEETLNGAKWLMLQKVTLQPLQLVFGMVLARLISPEEMGILGLTAIFFAVASTLASAGFASALIRKIDRTEADINTMFWFNAAMSLLMSMILFAAAPWFATFFAQPDLTLLTQISAGMMFLNSFSGVHWTLYTCNRDFRTPALIQGSVAILSMPVCLTLAYMGWSYWAVVAQGVFSGVLNLVIVWYVSPWKPRFLFSVQSFKELFGFGSKLAASGLLLVLYRELRTFIIGKFYSPADLGLFSRGSHLAATVPNTVGGVLDSVSYPILATVQNDEVRLLAAYRKYICTSTMVLTWSSLMLCALAEPLVRIVYGEQWMFCVPYVQVVSLSCAFLHVSIINLNLLKVKGRSDLFLRLEVIKRVLSIGMLLYAATVSVVAMCWCSVIYTQLAIFINCYYTGKIINLTWWQQQKDYLPYALFSMLSTLPAWLCAYAPVDVWFPVVAGDVLSYVLYYGAVFMQLVVGVLAAAALYFGTLHWRRDKAYVELLRCVAANEKLMRIGIIRRWCASIEMAS